MRAVLTCAAALTATLLLVRLAPAGPEERPALPQGHTGIAAAHPGDKGIAKHPSVVFAEDFEAGLPAQSEQRWSEVKNVGDMTLSDEVPQKGAGKQSLLYITKAPEGKVSRVWFDHIVLAKEYVGPIAGESR